MVRFNGYKKILSAVAVVIFLSALSGCGQRYTGNEPILDIAVDANKASAEEETSFVSLESAFHLPILGIHHVGPAPATASADARVWYISKEKLESILAYIKDNDYHTLFASEAVAYIKEGQLPEKAVVLTFDDGAEDFYTHAWPLLKQYDIKATVNVMTGVRGKDWLSADHIQEMHADGSVEFQSHTRYHAYLTRISEAEAREELAASKAYLEELTGNPVTVIAYPFGLYNNRIIALAKEVGYESGMTIHSGSEQQRENLFELRRFLVTEHTDIARILFE
jgi:peptidoglycan/xylan/chitin deacetylase (PgdA/CDA1 family)